MAYAELGKHRVLLLEASFRVAALGEVFGFLPPKGFAGQLAQHRSRPADPWVVVQIGNAPLYVMAAEPRACPSCAAVLAEEARFCPMCGEKAGTGANPIIDGVAFSAAIKHFRQSFDYLIVDAPSVLASGEVNLIQDAADAIVFATRKGQLRGAQPPPRHRAGRPGAGRRPSRSSRTSGPRARVSAIPTVWRGQRRSAYQPTVRRSPSLERDRASVAEARARGRDVGQRVLDVAHPRGGVADRRAACRRSRR